MEKIYGETQRGKKNLKVVNEIEQDDEDYKNIERQKIRETRIRKNEERMNSIKSIYETYSSKKKGFHSEKKFFDTDVEDKKEKIKMKKDKPDNEFNEMVNRKLATERHPVKKAKQNKSMTKLTNKSNKEDKMI